MREKVEHLFAQKSQRLNKLPLPLLSLLLQSKIESTCILIAAFHEITIKQESELKTQLFFSDISANHNLG